MFDIKRIGGMVKEKGILFNAAYSNMNIFVAKLIPLLLNFQQTPYRVTIAKLMVTAITEYAVLLNRVRIVERTWLLVRNEKPGPTLHSGPIFEPF